MYSPSSKRKGFNLYIVYDGNPWLRPRLMMTFCKRHWNGLKSWRVSFQIGVPLHLNLLPLLPQELTSPSPKIPKAIPMIRRVPLWPQMGVQPLGIDHVAISLFGILHLDVQWRFLLKYQKQLLIYFDGRSRVYPSKVLFWVGPRCWVMMLWGCAFGVFVRLRAPVSVGWIPKPKRNTNREERPVKF